MSDKPEKLISDDKSYDPAGEVQKSSEHARSVKELFTERRPDSCASWKQSDQNDQAAKEN